MFVALDAEEEIKNLSFLCRKNDDMKIARFYDMKWWG